MENETAQTNCPKCGGENPPDARFCCSCGSAMTEGDTTDQRIYVKVSTMAVVAFVIAIGGLALIMPLLISMTGPRSPALRSRALAIAFLMGVIVLAITAVLGPISIIRIEQSGGRITGRGFAVGSTLIAILGSALWPVWAVMFRMSHPPSGPYCGTNLSGIGKAMLIYSNDYDDEFPRSGGENSTWAQKIPAWDATSRFQAYGVSTSGEGGVGTISSCYYLLVKYAELEPKSLLCKSEPRARPFDPARYAARNKDLIDLWDFGPEPWKHYTYSYHMPFGPYALTTSYLPGVAVAADRNPWMASPFAKAGDFSKFDPDGDREAIKAGNTIGHHADGQNVLFVDAHVGFEKLAFCGVDTDNIYTFWDGEDIRRGAPPVLGSQPQSRRDSLLVHDPPPSNKK